MFFKKKENQSEDLVKIPSVAYQTPGSFGILMGNYIEWDKCRERFQNKSDNGLTTFLFYLSGSCDDVIDFVKTFEEAVNCPPGQEVEFKKTTNKNVLQVQMSEWWMYRVRRSLLTVLLRCGQNYTSRSGECFVKALHSQTYLTGTLPALQRFMEGYTACKMKKNAMFPGWFNFFNGKNKSQIDSCLVKLKKKREKDEGQVRSDS